jgi:hypothetical protein
MTEPAAADGSTALLARLRALDALLPALADVLDVREVFERVSQVAGQAVPHDLLSLLLVAPDGTITVHAVAGGEIQFPQQVPMPEHRRGLLTEPWEFVIDRDVLADPLEREQAAATAGYRARLLVPIRLRGVLAGTLNFVSRQPDRYSPGDVVVARRIADQIALALAHQQLAEESRRAERLRAREASLDLLDDLLATVTGSGKLPEVWDRISAVVQRVLPHDALLLAALLPDGVRGRVYASAAPGTAAFAEIVHVPPAVLENPRWESDRSTICRRGPIRPGSSPRAWGIGPWSACRCASTASTSRPSRCCPSRRRRTARRTSRRPDASPRGSPRASPASGARRCKNAPTTPASGWRGSRRGSAS